MSKNEETTTLWFVRDGKMMSGYVLATVSFDLRSKACSTAMHPMDVAGHLLSSRHHGQSIPKPLSDMVKRPGDWYLLSGIRWVHYKDCFTTREHAAENYRKYLLEDTEQNDNNTA